MKLLTTDEPDIGNKRERGELCNTNRVRFITASITNGQHVMDWRPGKKFQKRGSERIFVQVKPISCPFVQLL